MSNSAWDEVRRLSDEVRLKMHLAGMELKEKWKSLEPQLAEAQRKVMDGSDKAEEATTKHLGAIAAGLRQFIGELTESVGKKQEPVAQPEAPKAADPEPEPSKE